MFPRCWHGLAWPAQWRLGQTMDPYPAARTSRDTLPMSVAQMGFLVDRLHQDCSPLQFLRELTKNSIEGILQLDESQGEIRWDIDWVRLEISDEAPKLCIIDTGIGMTGLEMQHYINKLSSSVHPQSAAGNFGVGAKISAAPLNPEGLVYLSWHQGQGYMIQLCKDRSTDSYGLLRFQNGEFWCEISDEIKPEPIEDHGTMIVLLGTGPDQSTVEPPAGVKMPRKWLLRYLNSRFYRFPEGIAVKAREGWDLPKGDKHNFLRTVTGQGPWLEENAQASGTVHIPEPKADVHWWIIRPDADVNSGHYLPGGHVAALYQDELYEAVYGTSGYARLQNFGVVFGCDRVVLYVEPKGAADAPLTANTARTNLLIGSEPLPWSLYASEFRERMPQQLRDYQDEIGLESGHTDHRRAIQERLRNIRELFHFARYRPKDSGKHRMDDDWQNTGASTSADAKGDSGERADQQPRQRPTGDLYALFTQESGQPAEQVNSPIEPEVSWISVEDHSRSPGDLEDRAARYLTEQNLLLINGDFQAFTEMFDRWTERYKHIPGCGEIVKSVVREWFEQQLVETVMSAVALRQTGRWSTEEIEELVGETALTAAVLPRYHVDYSIKRALGRKLGSLAGTVA